MDERIGRLEAARLALGLSITDLWWRYFALGGRNSQMELEAILYHALAPTDQEYDRLAIALNERALELGDGSYPVPYAGDPSLTEDDEDQLN